MRPMLGGRLPALAPVLHLSALCTGPVELFVLHLQAGPEWVGGWGEWVGSSAKGAWVELAKTHK